MREELERREREAASGRSEEQVARARFAAELERLRERAAEKQAQRNQAVHAAAAAAQAAQSAASSAHQEQIGEQLKRSLKVRPLKGICCDAVDQGTPDLPHVHAAATWESR